MLALHLTGLLPEIVNWLSDVELAVGKYRLSLWTLLSAAFWVAMTLLLALWAGAALEARLLSAESLHSSLRVVLARLARAVLLVAAVLVVLPLMGVDLTVLSVFGGALGVGLGLGLQKIASNYLSGFIILLDRSIRLGDMITVDGHYGEVTRITTRYMVVRTLDGSGGHHPQRHAGHQHGAESLLLPTSGCAWRCACRSPTARTWPATLRTTGRHGDAGHPRVLAEPEPTAQVLQLADSGVDLELGFWIEDPERGSQAVRSDVSVAILREFRARGIEIPYPQREVRMLGAGPDPNSHRN